MMGSTRIMGQLMQQTNNALNAFSEMINDAKPARFIEIGTGWGGLSIFLSLAAPILTIDTYDRRERKDLFIKLGIDYRPWDVFEHLNVIEQIIRLKGTTVVLCDGGDKPREFKTLAPFIKPGDIIMAHDYGKDKNIWEWEEIDDSVLIGLDYLDPYLQIDFTEVAWLCRRRV